ncbi:hypothetical protein POSPLADRAFT_1139475 [Postia placenta MAD-698-R-SB12]|uniref:Uncharacterized protein n=1 Tax=Postia placenta MAD-698-R-SB12 TaxID=670580 RepID=A0A1X6N419_9APHY|nr:hypothetical protein POSPLADRAFT_1139475 [Postia placenta MAD-698-R-SB12]OSX63391.1 hypothetical protein POSPLADRAFT_1139475 [Postia placenta MAD-698-R-SB12]
MSAPAAPYIPEPGHIAAIHSSVLAPFVVLFDMDKPGSQASEDSSLGDLGTGLKFRPCIVMSAAPGEEVTICIMTTWGGASLAQLPDVYQHFSIVVNQGADDYAGIVVNTTPTWQVKGGRTQYLIPIAYAPCWALHRQWMKEKVPYVATPEQMDRVDWFRYHLLRIWMDCRDSEPGFVAEEQRKWLVCSSHKRYHANHSDTKRIERRNMKSNAE